MECRQQPVGEEFIPEKGLWVSLWNYKAWELCHVDSSSSHRVTTEPQCPGRVHKGRYTHTGLTQRASPEADQPSSLWPDLKTNSYGLHFKAQEARSRVGAGTICSQHPPPAPSSEGGTLTILCSTLPDPDQCLQRLWGPFWTCFLQEALTTLHIPFRPPCHRNLQKEPLACSPSQRWLLSML